MQKVLIQPNNRCLFRPDESINVLMNTVPLQTYKFVRRNRTRFSLLVREDFSSLQSVLCVLCVGGCFLTVIAEGGTVMMLCRTPSDRSDPPTRTGTALVDRVECARAAAGTHHEMAMPAGPGPLAAASVTVARSRSRSLSPTL